MTNKPMLSVEREMLERWTTGRVSLSHLAEMRALLDAQHIVCSNGILCQNSKCAECGGNGSYKPAAQHQGDTNPITGDMYRLMEAYRIGEFSAESGSETVEALSVAAFDSVESQGHDADSYMAGYCAALYEQGKPFIGLALKPKHQVEPVKWERMSIMEGGKWWPCDDKEEADAAVLCGWKVRALYAEQPAPVAEVMPFAEKVIAKLQRFEACVSDGQDVDIDRHWFDVLTHLGLLRRVQRSPAYWEITQQGEDALKTTHCNSPQ